MWIVPKTLSHFVPDTGGLNLDLEERAWMLESSAMWKSKPSSKQTWLRRLNRNSWLTALSTRILKPSLHESFEEKYTDSLEDIHANHSVAQESEKEKKTQDTYGHTSSSMSGQLDLFGAFGKMSGDTPRWGYGESCPIWKRKVTKRSGDCSRRRKQARLTSASDASSWPTATARDHKGCYKTLVRKDGKPRGDLLPDAVNIAQSNSQTPATPKAIQQSKDVSVRAWATPQASDHVEGARTAKESNQKCLGRDLNQMNWPTPTAMSRPRSEETMEKCLKFRKSKGKNSVPLYLEEKVRKEENWPTPLEDDSSNVNPNAKRRTSLVKEANKHAGLPAQEKSNTLGKNQGSWPTARSSDAEGGRIKTEKTEKGFRSKREKSDQYFGAKLRDAAEMEKPPTMKLNPNWVEQLMGLPVGWTQLPTEWIVSDSSEMALSANVQN